MNERLVTLLSEVFNLRKDEIHLELKKEDVGSWDSLKQMDMVMSLEREYSVILEITEIITMVSISDIVDVLRKKGVNLED